MTKCAPYLLVCRWDTDTRVIYVSSLELCTPAPTLFRFMTTAVVCGDIFETCARGGTIYSQQDHSVCRGVAHSSLVAF